MFKKYSPFAHSVIIAAGKKNISVDVELKSRQNGRDNFIKNYL